MHPTYSHRPYSHHPYSGRSVALSRTPTYRHQAQRRWVAAVCGVLALAMASGLIGALTHPSPTGHTMSTTGPTTGPFSYIPAE